MIPTIVASAPSPSPSPAATPNAEALALAQTWFAAAQQGKIPDPGELTPDMKAALTPAMVAQVQAQAGPLGAPTAFDQIRTLQQNGLTIYIYKMTFKDASVVDFILALTPDGKIAGMRIAPPQ